MMVNDSHGVQEHPNIPPSYKERVKIEGRATLVIKNINPGDNIQFRCELIIDRVIKELLLYSPGTNYWVALLCIDTIINMSPEIFKNFSRIKQKRNVL